MKYKISNQAVEPALTTPIETTVKESAKHFGVDAKIIGGENQAYGSPEYVIIETEEDTNSSFIKSLEYQHEVSIL